MSRGAKEPGVHELVRLTRFLLDTAKVEDLPEMLHAMCPTASRKILLAHLLISSTASSLQQMLGMLHAEPVAAAEILVQVITNIEGECPIQLQEHSDGSFSLNEEKTVQGAICRVVSLDVGDTCEKYAEDLIRLGVQLPLWTSRDIARFSSSPNLQEKVVNWFVAGLACLIFQASLSDQVLVLLQGCCLVSNLHTALPRPAPSCAQIVAECLAAAEAFRECLFQSAYLLKSNKCVESLIWDLLQPKSAELVPHCEERFGCILGGALEAQVRHVETLQPHARLHSLWRLGSVVLTWRHLVQLCCEDEDQFLTFLAKPGNYTSWRPGCSAKMVGKAYHHQVISPMMEEEQRAWCEVAERAANEAMAELLAEPDQASGSKRKAKRGKKSDAKSDVKSDAGPACSGTNGCAQKNAEEVSTLAMEDLELPESLIQSWQHLTVQLLMMERGSPRDL